MVDIMKAAGTKGDLISAGCFLLDCSASCLTSGVTPWPVAPIMPCVFKKILPV